MTVSINAQPEQTVLPEPEPPISLQSRLGLNAANFFVAEVTGVVLPFVNDLLQSRQWRYDAIGLATALAGLGVGACCVIAGWWFSSPPRPCSKKCPHFGPNRNVPCQPSWQVSRGAGAPVC